MTRSAPILLAAFAPLLVGACHGRTRFEPAPLVGPSATVAPAAPLPPRALTPATSRVPRRQPVAGPPSPAPRRGGRVFLSDRDLAPVDAFIAAGLKGSNSQWILGDEVEVIASREFFAQNLTVNETLGTVRRRDTTRRGETVVELTYLGAPGTASITTSPRILIGTGINVTARRRLVLRLVKTQDAMVPLRLRITARGDASRGRRDEVWVRSDALVLGCEIRRQGNRWVWYPIG